MKRILPYLLLPIGVAIGIWIAPAVRPAPDNYDAYCSYLHWQVMDAKAERDTYMLAALKAMDAADTPSNRGLIEAINREIAARERIRISLSPLISVPAP